MIVLLIGEFVCMGVVFVNVLFVEVVAGVCKSLMFVFERVVVSFGVLVVGSSGW